MDCPGNLRRALLLHLPTHMPVIRAVPLQSTRSRQLRPYQPVSLHKTSQACPHLTHFPGGITYHRLHPNRPIDLRWALLPPPLICLNQLRSHFACRLQVIAATPKRSPKARSRPHHVAKRSDQYRLYPRQEWGLVEGGTRRDGGDSVIKAPRVPSLRVWWANGLLHRKLLHSHRLHHLEHLISPCQLPTQFVGLAQYRRNMEGDYRVGSCSAVHLLQARSHHPVRSSNQY